jgi:hypothetical protein
MPHFPLTGQKKSGIDSCSVSRNLLLSTRMGSITLSISCDGGVKRLVIFSRDVASYITVSTTFDSMTEAKHTFPNRVLTAS